MVPNVLLNLLSKLRKRDKMQGYVELYIAFYSPTKSEGYSFGVVRLSILSVRPHFLSVRNHISVPIDQI